VFTRLEEDFMPITFRTRVAIAALFVPLLVSGAQTSPFLFGATPRFPNSQSVIALDAGYNERAFEPVAGERWEPRASAFVTLTPWLAAHGQIGAANTLDQRTRVSEQMELMATPWQSGSMSLGTNIGMRHEYSGANVALARVVGARVTQRAAVAADVLFEHPFVSRRDAVDVVTTVGAMRALTSRVWLGVEAVGSDLEGFFDTEEAEGGATLLVGPTVAVAVSDKWRLVVGGGPVIRATTSATRPDQPSSGYVVRTSLRLGW
jgi:hypothetical protein